MRGLLIRWMINSGALLIISYVLRGIEVQGILPAFAAAAVLGIVNAVIRPLVMILTFPINILTLGLFTFIINGAMLYLVGKLVRGFTVTSFWSAVLGALLLSIISWSVNAFISDEGRIRTIRVHFEE